MSSTSVRDYFRKIVLLNKALSSQRGEFKDSRAMGGGERATLWLGCNVLRTPHLVQLAVDIMRLVTPNVSVLGGPAHCCGAPDPDPVEKERALARTIGHFQAEEPTTLVSWCPSCHFQLRSRSDEQSWGFGECHISQYLLERLERLKFQHRVPARVLLHGHCGTPDRERDWHCTKQLLSAIPGVTIVGEHVDQELGLHCVPALVTPAIGGTEYQHKLDQIVQLAHDKAATMIVTIYHSCYRELEKRVTPGDPQIENYVIPLALSLGLTIPRNRYREVAHLDTKGRNQFTTMTAERGIDEAELKGALKDEFNADAGLSSDDGRRSPLVAE